MKNLLLIVAMLLLTSCEDKKGYEKCTYAGADFGYDCAKLGMTKEEMVKSMHKALDSTLK